VKIYLKRTRPIIVGITGSVGKTSTRMIISHVLTQVLPDQSIYTSPQNFNSEIGLSLSLLQRSNFTLGVYDCLSVLGQSIIWAVFSKKRYDICVLEYGIDHPHDMKFLTTIAKADIAIFTKLDAVHSQFFPSIEAVGDEKFLLMKTAKKRVYLNAFDDYCKAHSEDIRTETIFYNQDELKVEQYQYIQEKDNIYAQFETKYGMIRTNIVGEENAVPFVIGLDIAQRLQEETLSFSEPLYAHIDLIPGRSSVLLQ
jgi:UDP-N-acetylmuramyl pentapeptide synthase